MSYSGGSRDASPISVPPLPGYSLPVSPDFYVPFWAFAWQQWQTSGLRLGYPDYMTCDLFSEPTLKATQAVVQNLIFFLKGSAPIPSEYEGETYQYGSDGSFKP